MGVFATGLGLGFLVAAQVGPIWLLCLRTSARFGFRSGVAVGAGAAVVDTLYAALGVAGAAPLLQIDALRLALGLTGAAVLGVIGFRTLRDAFRVRLGAEGPTEIAAPRRAFATSVAATASNPMTIISWAAVFSAASTAGADRPLPLIAGVGVGSLAWFVLLAAGTSAARRRLGTRFLRVVDAVAGTGLLAFAGVLGWRTLRG